MRGGREMNDMELITALLNELVNESVDWHREKVPEIAKYTDNRFSGQGTIFDCDFADLHDETQCVEKIFIFDDRGTCLGVRNKFGFRTLK